MKQENGSIAQRGLMGNPADRASRRYYAPTRGIIENVKYRDQADGKQTTADIYLVYYQARRYNVPFVTSRMSKTLDGNWHGEEWTPEQGNMVLVDFLDGNESDPVIVACFNSPNNPIQATASEAPHYKKLQNRSSETIEKDGTRRVHVAASDFLEAVQDLTVTVLNGLTKLISKGKTLIQSQGTVEIDGTGGGQVYGAVNGQCLCAFTGAPHPQISQSVKVSN